MTPDPLLDTTVVLLDQAEALRLTAQSQAYRLLHHADTLAELAEAAGLDSPMGENLSERTTRNLDVPAAAALVAAVAHRAPTEHEWAMGAVWDRMLARRCHLEAS